MIPAKTPVPETTSPQSATARLSAQDQRYQDISDHLVRSLVLARSSSIENAKLVIAPLSLDGSCGAVAASALANLSNRREQITKVVILVPARRNALRGIAIPSRQEMTTPFGTVEIDTATLRRLGDLPQVTVDDRSFEDEHLIEPLLPILQACLARFKLIPIVVGNVYPELVSEVLSRAWGGHETFMLIASDLSHHLPDDRARAYDIETRGIIETLAHDQLTTERADGHRIIAGAMIRAEMLDLRATGLDFRTTIGAAGKARGHGAFAFEPAQSARLSSAERRYLLRLAAQSVMAAAENPAALARPLTAARLPMPLSAIRAATVTIMNRNTLRGSAGSLRPYRTLVAEVIARAAEASKSDTRFLPVTTDELRDLEISISITSHPRPVRFESDEQIIAAIVPGRDGLVIEHRGRSVRAMPSLWDQIPEPDLFLRALRQRAGLGPDEAPPGVLLRRFTAETFSAPLATLAD